MTDDERRLLREMAEAVEFLLEQKLGTAESNLRGARAVSDEELVGQLRRRGERVARMIERLQGAMARVDPDWRRP